MHAQSSEIFDIVRKYLSENVKLEKVQTMDLKIRFSGKDTGFLKLRADATFYYSVGTKESKKLQSQDAVILGKGARLLFNELNDFMNLPDNILEVRFYCPATEWPEAKVTFNPSRKGK